MYHQSPTPEHEGLGRDVFFKRTSLTIQEKCSKRWGRTTDLEVDLANFLQNKSSSRFHPLARTNLCSQHGSFVGKWGSLRASVPMEAAGIGPGGLNNSGPALMMAPSGVTQWSLVTRGVSWHLWFGSSFCTICLGCHEKRGFESWENAGNPSEGVWWGSCMNNSFLIIY